jgi:acyl-CoA thioesterase-1
MLSAHPLLCWSTRLLFLFLLSSSLSFAQPKSQSTTADLSTPNSASALGTDAQGQSAQSIDVLVLGDSLSAEYGLERNTGWVSLLEQKMKVTPGGSRADTSNSFKLVNASISGETTAGGRARLPILLKKYHPKVLVIELGANDALRGLNLEAAKANLIAMVQAGLGQHAHVLLIGNLVPANYGEQFNKDLSAMFKQVAQSTHCALVPFMLRGVADAPNARELFQADQLHPLARAHPTILSNIWPELSKLLH